MNDLISRQAVLEVIRKSHCEEWVKAEIGSPIETLPSVNLQEPKTGHWESTELFYEGESRGAIIKCIECGNEFKVSPKVFERLYDNERFCNHCGCRMVEPQESDNCN